MPAHDERDDWEPLDTSHADRWRRGHSPRDEEQSPSWDDAVNAYEDTLETLD